MASSSPVTVGPPDDEGGRLVHVYGIQVGYAYDLWDIVLLLRRAGLKNGFADGDELAASQQIAWLGAGPEMWERSP
ncbi:hypothetical protein ABZZ74_47450 [Streptomyces sp. NPDC006476]|uniref:hypothetical protein n=1 Tax=Streptomyces sp. NPDC006476 TaxID=3157175 RepID=UPI0033B704D1